jgi:hypothetical protein
MRLAQQTHFAFQDLNLQCFGFGPAFLLGFGIVTI